MRVIQKDDFPPTVVSDHIDDGLMVVWAHTDGVVHSS